MHALAFVARQVGLRQINLARRDTQPLLGVVPRLDADRCAHLRLAAPLHLAGAPKVDLVASTSGTDSDWIVILPADGPLAVITLVLSSVTFCFAISTTSPFSFRAAVLARIVPPLRIIPA